MASLGNAPESTSALGGPHACCGRRASAALGNAGRRASPSSRLVTPATAPDLSVLLLLSSLSEHTRHLLADARCSLLVAGPAGRQSADRAAGDADRAGRARAPTRRAKARWLAVHPYAALYAGFARFHAMARPAGAGVVRRRLRPGAPAAPGGTGARPGGGGRRCGRPRHHGALQHRPCRRVGGHRPAARAAPGRMGDGGRGRGRVRPDGGRTCGGLPGPAPRAGAGEVRAELVGLAAEARGGCSGAGMIPLHPAR